MDDIAVQLNEQQDHILNEIRRVAVNDILRFNDTSSLLKKDERDHTVDYNNLSTKSPEQTANTLLFITGEAGTGKSTLLKQIVYMLRALYERKSSTLVVAPTGVAAYLAGGQTIHSAFVFPPTNKITSLTGNITKSKMECLTEKLQNVRWLIIDEISMVSAEVFEAVDRRLKVAMRMPHKPFAGINVIVCGDILQLQPVKSTWIFEAYKKPWSIQPPLWSYFRVIHLTRNMRQQNDDYFRTFCSTLRVGTQTRLECKNFVRRRQLSLLCTNEQKHFEHAIHIFQTKKEADVYNRLKTSMLPKTYEFSAHDVVIRKTLDGNEEKEIVCYDHNCDTRALSVNDVPYILVIGVGSKIMLRKNINVNCGLVNGRTGKITNIIFSSDQQEDITFSNNIDVKREEALYKNIDQKQHNIESVNHLAAATMSNFAFNGKNGNFTTFIEVCFDSPSFADCESKNLTTYLSPDTLELEIQPNVYLRRLQFPVIQAWGRNVHKTQGETYTKIVYHINDRIRLKGTNYIGISRVKSEKDIAIVGENPDAIYENKPDAAALAEYHRICLACR